MRRVSSPEIIIFSRALAWFARLTHRARSSRAEGGELQKRGVWGGGGEGCLVELLRYI